MPDNCTFYVLVKTVKAKNEARTRERERDYEVRMTWCFVLGMRWLRESFHCKAKKWHTSQINLQSVIEYIVALYSTTVFFFSQCKTMRRALRKNMNLICNKLWSLPWYKLDVYIQHFCNESRCLNKNCVIKYLFPYDLFLYTFKYIYFQKPR